tara:strand:- start:36 stop:1139 length:1104 start_codon:yes stop_codon:yes gene_type:complete
MKLINDFKKTLETLGFTLAKHQPLHAKRQETNQLQISCISKKKIDAILENTGIVINPRKKEHREKYFSGVKPIKFLRMLVEEDSNFELGTFNMLADNFLEQFTKGLVLTVWRNMDVEIPKVYSLVPNELNDNGKRTFITGSGSCMQGKNKEYFEIYKDTKGLEIVTLEDSAGNLYGRALLWSAPDTELKYLDRIYIADSLSGSDKIRATYQAQIYRSVCKMLKVDKINCYSLSHFSNLLTETEKDAQSKPPNPFNPRLKDGADAMDYDYFPYADTFQGLSGDRWATDSEGEDVGLTNTDGTNANDNTYCCDSCGDRVHEDDIYYAEQDDEYLCENCCTYSDYEDNYINNDYLVEHRHTGDLFHQDNI